MATTDLSSGDPTRPAPLQPATSAAPSGPDGPRPVGRLLVRVAAALAWLAVVAFTLALVLAFVPVQDKRPEVDQAATDARRTESGQSSAYVFRDGAATLQDCGAPLAFVVQGRTQVSYGGGTSALERAREKEANKHRCTDRVAARLVPAGYLVLATVVVALASFVLTYLGRSKARAAFAAAHTDRLRTAPAAPGPPGGTPSAG